MNRQLRERIESEIAALEARGLRRSMDAGREGLADFTTNDVLGLARDGAVAEAIASAAVECGAGSAASRLLGGERPIYAAAEIACAQWLGAESALLLPSGFQANLALIATLAQPGALVVSDALNHASIVDACRLARESGARVVVAPHRDVGAVEHALAAGGDAAPRFVVTESVFSMDGDLAPLAELLEVCERRDAHLIVDEAHAVGLLGPRGAGAVAALAARGVDVSRVAARLATGGKALGLAGAFVVGDEVLRELLIQRARPLMFTTAPIPALAGGLVQSIQLAQRMDAQRAAVLERARRIAQALGLPRPDAAIVPFITGSGERALALSARAREVGLDVRAVRHPSVPRGAERLRIVVHAFNTDAEVERLVELLRDEPRVAAPVATVRERARAVVVVGTDTDVGKTCVSALLARFARTRGAARYFKLVQTGADSDSRTVAALAGLAPGAVEAPLHELPLPASPHEAAAAAGIALDPDALVDGLGRVVDAAGAAALVIELAGGVFVPYTLAFQQIDLLERVRLPLVLVARSGLGTLNHTQLTLEALRRRRLEPRALFLVGEPHAANAATLRALARVPRVFEVPHFPSLDAAALDRWLDHNDLAGVFDA